MGNHHPRTGQDCGQTNQDEQKGWCLDGPRVVVVIVRGVFLRPIAVSFQVLKKHLWGNYTFSHKNQRIQKWSESSKRDPLFVQLFLNNLWQMCVGMGVVEFADII